MATPAIPAQMLAAQVTKHSAPYTLATVPVPQPEDLEPHELLVKVAVASHCHTDLMVRAGVFGGKLPQTGSHEGAGTVVFAGPAAGEEFRPGTRVMCGLLLQQCGTCGDCVAPPEQYREHYCIRVGGSVGVVSDGCFAEYVRVDARQTTPLPAAVPLLHAAPLACAGRTVWRALRLARAEIDANLTRVDDERNGDGDTRWLAIVGAGGGLGHLAVQFARAQGLRVVAIDARDEGLALARELGADVVLDARLGNKAVMARVVEVTGERRGGVDATMNLADVQGAVALACAITRMHGAVVQVAQPELVSIPFTEFVFRDIRIRGTALCAPNESREMVDFIAKHGLVVETVPFRGLEKIHELVEAVEEGKIKGKAVIIVDQEQLDREKKA